MIGTIVNAVAIAIGSGAGLFLKKGFSKNISDSLMMGLGLVNLYMGVSGSLNSEKTLVMILSIVLGGFIGARIDIDGTMNKLGNFAEMKLTKNSSSGKFSEGFISASILFCTGAMGVVGSIQSALTGNNETIFAKAIMDGIIAAIYASTYGSGVLLSSLSVFVYQGSIVLLANMIAPVLGDAVIQEIGAVGSLLIIGIGLNMLKVTKLKLANYLPSIIIAPFLWQIIG